MADKKPNIIYFFTDQQRWDTCGCYGQPIDVTPNLDRMASEGVKFQNAFTCQPVCGPARACIQTGLWATQVGCPTNHRQLPPDATTIAKLAHTAGYETGYIGKWHLASRGDRNGPDDYRTKTVPPRLRGGYDDFWLASDVLEFTSHGYDGHMFDSDGHKREFPEGRYRVDAQTDWVIEYLNSRTGEKPFFLFTSYIEPHHQNDHGVYEGPHGSKDKYKDFVVPGDLVDTDGDWRENYPDYLGQINSLDENLGRIRAELEKLGMADNTVILYTSDHGSHFKTRNGEYKRCCHDGCTHIPMVAWGPGFRGGKVVEEMVSLIDTPPTVLAAAGVDVPETMAGRPLQQLADDGGAPADWPTDAYIQISESHTGRAVRTHKWTYSVRAPKGAATNDGLSDRYVEDFLYDLEADPHQKNNLVSDPQYASVREEMKARLFARMEAAGEGKPEVVPAGE
jgi:uncharacterized sulfatase